MQYYLPKRGPYDLSNTSSHSRVLNLNTEKQAGFLQNIPGVFLVSRNRIRQNIAAYAACADPYSSEFGPEYLSFRAVESQKFFFMKQQGR